MDHGDSLLEHFVFEGMHSVKPARGNHFPWQASRSVDTGSVRPLATEGKVKGRYSKKLFQEFIVLMKNSIASLKDILIHYAVFSWGVLHKPVSGLSS